MASTTSATAANRPEGAEILSEERRDAARGEPPFTEAPTGDSRLVASLKEAGITAAIIAVITLFFLAFRSDIASGGLSLTLRPELWLVWVVIAFGVRFLLSYFVFRSEQPITGFLKKTFAPTSTRSPSQPLIPSSKIFKTFIPMQNLE